MLLSDVISSAMFTLSLGLDEETAPRYQSALNAQADRVVDAGPDTISGGTFDRAISRPEVLPSRQALCDTDIQAWLRKMVTHEGTTRSMSDISCTVEEGTLCAWALLLHILVTPRLQCEATRSAASSPWVTVGKSLCW